MEWREDKAILRFLLFVAGAALVLGAAMSIIQGAWHPLLYVLAGLLACAVALLAVGVLNVIVFAPALSLMARLFDRNKRRRAEAKKQADP